MQRFSGTSHAQVSFELADFSRLDRIVLGYGLNRSHVLKFEHRQYTAVGTAECVRNRLSANYLYLDASHVTVRVRTG